MVCLFPTNSEHTDQLDSIITVSTIVVLEEQEINEEHGSQKQNLLVDRRVRREGQAERISVGELRETISILLRVPLPLPTTPS